MDVKEILKKVRQIEIRTRGVVNEVFAGEYHSVFKGRGMEFSEVREYQIGDDIRAIDWNVSARFGHPYVKVFEEERELIVMLLCDMSSSEHFGSSYQMKAELASEISAVLAFSALRNNDKVGLLLFTDTVEKFIPPKKGNSHVLRILRDLITFQPQRAGTSLANALEHLDRVLKKRAIVFLISDLWDTDYDKALRIVGRRHDLVVLHLYDPRERELPPAGLVKLHDAEIGTVQWIDAGSPTVRRQLASRFDQRMASIDRNFKLMNVDRVPLRIDQSYIRPIADFFRQRERRR
ncbi:hypothetical protein AMJ86_06305 [bacterium SM23_57]|nr:MAG: hypothetical protein AMJ86_06305 [bacterium SM23_57]